MRAWRYCILGVGLVAAATSCGGGSEDGVGTGEAAGEAPQDLSGELLSVDDLKGEWDTGGPEEFGDSDVGDVVTGPCPGQLVPLHDVERNVGAPGNATITFESVDADTRLVQWLSHDPTGELFEATRQVFDACVGEEWEQGDDPVENVKLETIDLGDQGDDAVGYRELWGSGGDYYGQDVFAVVRVGDVWLSLYLTEDNIDDPLEGDVFPDALAAAVAHLEDGKWAPAVDEPVAPEVDEPATVTVEKEEGSDGWGLVVRGNGGCRFLNQKNEGIAILDKEEIPDWHLAPNVEWLVQQIFEVYPRVSLGVDADRVGVTLYKPHGGTTAIGVDRETAERAADELRERLGNRSVCGIESSSTTTTSEPPSTTTTSDAPVTTETGASEVFPEDLRPGDCFNDSGHGTPDVGEITRVDCGSPHDAEVFGVPTLPGETGAPYPGDGEIDSLSDALCMGEFASYVGIDFQDSKWEFAYMPPDEVSWNKYDDRLVVCSLNDPSFNKIEGSKRGTRT
jgi:hypothetical protein